MKEVMRLTLCSKEHSLRSMAEYCYLMNLDTSRGWMMLNERLCKVKIRYNDAFVCLTRGRLLPDARISNNISPDLSCVLSFCVHLAQIQCRDYKCSRVVSLSLTCKSHLFHSNSKAIVTFSFQIESM